VPVDIDALVADLVAASEDAEPEGAVREVLARAVARPNEIAEALGYRIDLASMILFRSDALTVQRFVIPSHYAVRPHEHRMWAVIGAFGGRERNTLYRRSATGIAPSGGRTMEPGDVMVLGDEAIHDVTSGEEPVGAIHVYGGNLWATDRSEWCGEPLVERRLDVAADATRYVAAARAAGLLVES
jgi:predicted metal-dependent enzyme (double-stranded beta helix superfamily)